MRRIRETRNSMSGAVSRNFLLGKPICELAVTLVASNLPTFCALPLAKHKSFA
jgi:hypothetical protein